MEGGSLAGDSKLSTVLNRKTVRGNPSHKAFTTTALSKGDAKMAKGSLAKLMQLPNHNMKPKTKQKGKKSLNLETIN